MSPSPEGLRYLAVIWEQDGYIDLIPERALCESSPNLVHRVRGPRGGLHLADCTVEVAETSATLTYSASGLNAKWHLGKLRIDDGASSHPKVFWVNADGTTDDNDVGFAVWLEDLTGPAAEDILGVLKDNEKGKKQTSIRALIDARLGQGKFRSDLDLEWQSRCAVTGSLIRELLRASHIKPWHKSNSLEKTDPNNGILLAAHVDALFDKHLISFDDDGGLICSSRLQSADLKALGLENARLRHVPEGMKPYLTKHRDQLLKS